MAIAPPFPTGQISRAPFMRGLTVGFWHPRPGDEATERVSIPLRDRLVFTRGNQGRLTHGRLFPISDADVQPIRAALIED